jgi:hypothetical protein
MSAKLNVDIVAQLKEFNKAMTDLKSEVDDVNKQVSKGNQNSVKSTNALSGAFSNLGKTLAGVFAADMLLSFGKAVIATTAEFQKMEAVLTTTLGSKSAAKVAMDQIVEFASVTPFQVNELTDAFVKLANRGFKPTMAEMTSLGDLASSTGKSFDQLTEAALDAMTGEFERLKEFGIRAKSEGDKVKFTFKGVTTEVEKTDAAIKDYLISLGNAEGVSGSMAAISETVGGKISNLQDNFSQLQLAIGSSSSGLISSVLELSNIILSDLVTSLNSVNTVAKAAGDTGLEAFGRQLLSFASPAYAATLEGAAIGIKAIEKAAVDSEEAIKAENKAKEESDKISDELAKKLQKEADAREKAHQELVKFSRSYELQMQDTTYATEEFTKAIAAKISEIGKIPKAGVLLKTYEDLFRKPITTAPFIDTPNLADGFTPTIEIADVDESEVTKKLLSFKAKAEEFRQAANAALQQGAVDTVTGFAGAIGAAFAGGENAFQSFGQALLGNLGMIMQQLGKAAIGIGITMDAIKKAFTNPFTAIAAGIALVAVGKFISTKVAGMTSGGGSKFAGSTNIGGQNAGLTPFAAGGIVSGPTAALVGEYPGARTNPEVIAPLNKLQNMLGGNVTFTISGDNLVGTLNRANKTRARKF